MSPICIITLSEKKKGTFLKKTQNVEIVEKCWKSLAKSKEIFKKEIVSEAERVEKVEKWCKVGKSFKSRKTQKHCKRR